MQADLSISRAPNFLRDKTKIDMRFRMPGFFRAVSLKSDTKQCPRNCFEPHKLASAPDIRRNQKRNLMKSEFANEEIDKNAEKVKN